MPECFHQWVSAECLDSGAACDVCFSCGKSQDEVLQAKPVEVLPDLTGNLNEEVESLACLAAKIRARGVI